MDGRVARVRHTCDVCHAWRVRRRRGSDLNAESGSPIIVSGRTDADLVAEATGGDIESFAELSRRYRNAYTRFAVRMVGDGDDAEDALQSAFIRAYRALEQCREPERFGAWLYQIVVNECRTFAARRARRERKVTRDELRLNAAAVDPGVDAQDTIEDVQYALA